MEKLCSSNYDSNCLKDNLKYGLDKLKTLSDEQLDLLDPYQRGGNNLSKQDNVFKFKNRIKLIKSYSLGHFNGRKCYS